MARDHLVKTKMRITLEDIARAAKVSVSTVSRALHGDPRVAVSTRNRILEAAQEMGYPLHPELLGRVHGGGNGEPPVTRRIALLIQTHEVFSFYGDAIMGLVEEGREYNIEVAMKLIPENTRLASHLDEAGNEGARAAVYLTWKALGEKEREELRGSPVPVILVNRHLEGLTPAVTIDDFAAGRLAAFHLMQLNHRRIACLSGQLSASAMRERTAGFRSALEQHGCYDPALFIERDRGRLIDWVQRSMDRLLSLPDPPTAIWAFNDMAASYVLMVANTMGLKVPEDLSVMGFDRNGQFRENHLTTFDIRQRVLARQTLRLALAVLDGTVEPGVRWCVVPALIPGATTGPAPNRDGR